MLSGMHRCVVLRFVAVIAIAAMTTSWAATTMAAVPAVERIGDDSGGRIGTYLSKFEALRKSGQRVVIRVHARRQHDSAQSYLRDAAGRARLPRRLGP